MKKKSIIKCLILALLPMIFSTLCKAQSAAGCFTSKGVFKGCYESWTDEYNGVSYRCYCNCAKTPPAECTPLQNSPAGTSSSSSTINNQKPDTEKTPDPEIEKQAFEREKAELEKQQAFEKGKLELSRGLKGKSSSTTPVLKTGMTSLPLKSGNSLPVDLKTAVPPTKEKEAEKIIPSDKNEDRKKSIELIELAREVQDEAIKLNFEADKTR
jgi:hypothetical protein